MDFCRISLMNSGRPEKECSPLSRNLGESFNLARLSLPLCITRINNTYCNRAVQLQPLRVFKCFDFLVGKDERNANVIYEKDNASSWSKNIANDGLRSHSTEDMVQWGIPANCDSEDVCLDNAVHRLLHLFSIWSHLLAFPNIKILFPWFVFEFVVQDW